MAAVRRFPYLVWATRVLKP